MTIKQISTFDVNSSAEDSSFFENLKASVGKDVVLDIKFHPYSGHNFSEYYIVNILSNGKESVVHVVFGVGGFYDCIAADEFIRFFIQPLQKTASVKESKMKKFTKILDKKGYRYEIKDGVCVVTHNGDVFLKGLEEMPENVLFKNNGDAWLCKLRKVHKCVGFKNNGLKTMALFSLKDWKKYQRK